MISKKLELMIRLILIGKKRTSAVRETDKEEKAKKILIRRLKWQMMRTEATIRRRMKPPKKWKSLLQSKKFSITCKMCNGLCRKLPSYSSWLKSTEKIGWPSTKSLKRKASALRWRRKRSLCISWAYLNETSLTWIRSIQTRSSSSKTCPVSQNL